MNAAEIKYPVGIQTFPKLIEGGYAYIDKTEFIKPIVESAAYYFRSRPRRFGKSRLLSTLHAFFEGRRDLFKGSQSTAWRSTGRRVRSCISISIQKIFLTRML